MICVWQSILTVPGLGLSFEGKGFGKNKTALQLAAEVISGLLDIDEPINRFFPSLPFYLYKSPCKGPRAFRLTQLVHLVLGPKSKGKLLAMCSICLHNCSPLFSGFLWGDPEEWGR